MSKRKREVKHYRHSKIATPEEVIAMVKGKTQCEICSEKADLVLDHCHATNTLRGVLCNACNSGLGNFRDNPTLMVSAMGYLANQQRKLDK
jgi:hypothetical protein